MHPEYHRPPLDWPELSDESAVELYDLIAKFMTSFESRYFGQIQRHFRHRVRNACTQPDFVQPDLFRSLDPDEPPF